MGMYDSVMVSCPKCGDENEFQSKSGECLLYVYTLDNCPDDVLSNVNRHSPVECDKCGFFYEVDKEQRRSVMSTDEFRKQAKELIKVFIEEFDNDNVSWETRDKAATLYGLL